MNTANDTENKSLHQNAIGIFGGTFDPIHIGHTIPAKSVARWLNLNKILLLPACIPPHKETPKISAQQRAKMVELVCENDSLFQCDLRELYRSGLSYTVETLKELKQDYPNKILFFIMGMDSLLTFTQWHNYKEILTLCHLVINHRPNYKIDRLNNETQLLLSHYKVDSLEQLKTKNAGAIIFAPKISSDINLDISSTNIRQQFANNEFCSQVSPDVLAFINKNQLYR